MEERMYNVARMYYKTHGNLLIVAAPDKSNNQQLKDYLNQLRQQYANGTLSEDIKERYDRLGMVWKDIEQHEWNYCYDLAKQYQKIFGTLEMPTAFEMNGVKLGTWLDEQKEAYKTGELSLGRENKLEKLGIRWKAKNFAQVSFAESSVAYYVAKMFPDTITSYKPEALKGREIDIYIPSLRIGIEYDGGVFHKNLDKDLVKNDLCAESGIRLIRVRDRLAPRMESSEKCTVINQTQGNTSGLHKAIKQVLSELGVKEMPDISVQRDRRNILNDMFEDRTYFNQYLMAAKHFYQDNGHLFVPKHYADPTGLKLGQWIQNIRDSREYLSENQINALDELDMVWESVSKEKWLCDFRKATSYEEIPKEETTIDGKSLKDWFETQKDKYENYEIYDDYKLDAFMSLEQPNEKEQEEVIKPKKRNYDYEL